MFLAGLNAIKSRFIPKDNEFANLLNHSKNYLLANFLLKGITILSLPVITRLLSASDFGVISVYFTIVSIFTAVYSLGMESSMYRYYFEANNDYSRFLGSNISYLISFVLLLSGLLIFFRHEIAEIISVEENVITFAIIIAALSIPTNLVQTHFQTVLESKKYATLNFTKFTSITAITIILLLMMKSQLYMGRLYAELAVASVLIIYTIPKLSKLSKFNFNPGYFKYTLVVGLPLLPHTLSMLILNVFDRLVINRINGQEEVGLYSFAYNIGMIMNMFVMGLNQSWGPIFFRKLSENNHDDVIRLYPKFSNFIFSGAILLIIFSKLAVIILGTEKYYASFDIIPMIVLSYVFFFIYTTYANYAFYHKTNIRITVFTFIAGFSNIGLNVLFLPFAGYKFAAYSNAISFFLLLVLHFVNVRYLLNLKNIISIKIILVQLCFVLISIGYFYILSAARLDFRIELLLNIGIAAIILFSMYKVNKTISRIALNKNRREI